jgi:hypothetical protein
MPPRFTVDADYKSGLVRVITAYGLDICETLRMAAELNQAAANILEQQHKDALDAKRFASIDEQDAADAASEATS